MINDRPAVRNIRGEPQFIGFIGYSFIIASLGNSLDKPRDFPKEHKSATLWPNCLSKSVKYITFGRNKRAILTEKISRIKRRTHVPRKGKRYLLVGRIVSAHVRADG